MSAVELRAAEAEMIAHPYPDVVHVPYQEEVVWTRAYRRINGHVVIYDAPNGNPIGQLSAGYNYVTVINEQDGFIQINYGQWVAKEHITWADVSEFAGVEIATQPKRPFAWMLAEARPSRYPGGPQDKSADIIPRYTLMNIYGVEYANGWEWYLVGPNQWVQQIRVAKVKPIARPAGVGEQDRWIAVDLYEQTAVAYEGDRMVFATLVSSGLPQWGTHEGLFQVYERYEATRMSGAAGQPDFYYIEEVPYVMYFDGDIGLHGTYWHASISRLWTPGGCTSGRPPKITRTPGCTSTAAAPTAATCLPGRGANRSTPVRLVPYGARPLRLWVCTEHVGR